MQAGGLLNSKAYTAQFENIYLQIWRNWCASAAEKRASLPVRDNCQPLHLDQAFFNSLNLHAGKVLTGISPDKKYFIKIEITANPEKLNSLQEEAHIMRQLNKFGSQSCPIVFKQAMISREKVLTCLKKEQKKYLESCEKSEFPFLMQQFIPSTDNPLLADILLTLLEQKNLGVYHSDLRPDNCRYSKEDGVCYLIDYDQAELLDEKEKQLDNLQFLQWCDKHAREKYRRFNFTGFLHNFPGIDFNTHIMPLFREKAFNLAATSIFKSQQTTLGASGIYHSIRKESLFADGERDLDERKILLDKILFQEAEKVLDVGCNAGLLSMYLHDRGCNVKGIDLDPAIIKGACFIKNILAKNIRFACYDLDQGPLQENFDTIMLFSVLHHTSNMAENAANIARACRRIIIECRLFERGAKPVGDIWQRTTERNFTDVDELSKFLEKIFPGFKLFKNHGLVDRNRYLLELKKLT